MSSWTPTKYKTRNWADYNFSLKQRGSLSIWFDPQMVWEAEASGRRGRQQTYSDAAIQACLTFKVLFGLPLRQTTGFVESLLKRAGLDWSVPDFSTLCRRPHYTTLDRFGMRNHGSTAARGSVRRSLRISSNPVRNHDLA